MKNKTLNTKTLVFGAFLLAIAFLIGGGLTRVTGIPTTIKINFGGANQNIGFTAVPLVIGSIVLGPIPGMIVAMIYDTLSYLLLTGGVWNPIFTLSEMMIGFVPGFIYKFVFKKVETEKNHLKEVIAGVIIYTFVVILLSSVMGKGTTDSQLAVQMISFENCFEIKNKILLAAFLISCLLSVDLLVIFGKKKHDTGLFSYDKLFIVTFVGLLLRSLVSGWGLWVYYGKTIPLIFYWLPRFITPMFTAPITAFIISRLGYILKKYTK